MKKRLAWTTALLLTLTPGCEDPVSPEDIPGTYTATTLTVEEGGTTQDLLSQGASITITLTSIGATEGELFIPEGAEGGLDLEADLTGTWRLEDSRLRFNQAADTFLRDMFFDVDGRRLSGEETFGDATVRLVLTRG